MQAMPKFQPETKERNLTIFLNKSQSVTGKNCPAKPVLWTPVD
jgi:hypothetical protein